MLLDNLSYQILGEVVSCVFSAVLCANILQNFAKTERKHRMFLYAGISCFLTALVDIFSIICISYYQLIPTSLGTFTSTIFFICLIFVPFAITDFAIEMTMEFKDSKKFFYGLSGIIYSIYIIIILLNVKIGWVFRYDPVEGYIRGSFKNVTYIMMLFFIALTIFLIICNRKSITKRIFIIFLTYPFVCALLMAVQFVFPKAVMTGASSFASLLMAYLTIQSDMLEYDSVTGLLCEKRLEQHLSRKGSTGFLYVLHIENLNFVQNTISSSDRNQMLLDMGNKISKCFERRGYVIPTNRFAGICNTKEELIETDKKIRKFIGKINAELKYGLPMPLEIYSAAIELTENENEKTYSNIVEIVNKLITTAKNNLSSELQICDDSVLVDMERKKYIYKILKRELTLESEQYQVWFQPIYSIAEEKFTYMEALSRLNGTEIGNIPPGEFVEVAEQRGLIEKLGFVAFEKVCKFIADNKGLINAISINFSVYQMTNPKLVETVLSTIERFGLKPENIIMEITESIFIDDYDIVYKNMTELANAGVKFYLDDFGTGYSNLSNVVSLPFKTIKMDRSLVLMMEDNIKNITLFRNLVSTFKGAGLNILVEGVETQNQNRLVCDAKVDYIQGFLYSRPLPPEKCVEVLSRQK